MTCALLQITKAPVPYMVCIVVFNLQITQLDIKLILSLRN